MDTLTFKQQGQLIRILVKQPHSWEKLAEAFSMSPKTIAATLPYGSTPEAHVRLLVSRLCNRGEQMESFVSVMDSFNMNGLDILRQIGHEWRPPTSLVTCFYCYKSNKPLGVCDTCRKFVCVACARQDLLPSVWTCLVCGHVTTSANTEICDHTSLTASFKRD